jgi:hypothetical protein
MNKKQKEHYWDATEPPDVLLDWVDENVIEATRTFWEERKPNWWIELKDDKYILKITGPHDPAGDCYVAEYDFIESLSEDIDVDRNDLRKLAKAINALAKKIP